MDLDRKAGARLHEVALMEEAIEILRSSVQANGIKQVTRVKMVIGRMTAVQPDSLKFAFEVFSSREDWLQEAQLEIEDKEVTAGCLDCGAVYEVKDYCFVCPVCAGSNHHMESGRELYIDYYEGD